MLRYPLWMPVGWGRLESMMSQLGCLWRRLHERGMLLLRGVPLLLQRGNSLLHITHQALSLQQCQPVWHPQQIKVILLSYSRPQLQEAKYHHLTMCS